MFPEALNQNKSYGYQEAAHWNMSLKDNSPVSNQMREWDIALHKGVLLKFYFSREAHNSKKDQVSSQKTNLIVCFVLEIPPVIVKVFMDVQTTTVVLFYQITLLAFWFSCCETKTMESTIYLKLTTWVHLQSIPFIIQ